MRRLLGLRVGTNNVRAVLSLTAIAVLLIGALLHSQPAVTMLASATASSTPPCGSNFVASAQGAGATMNATDVTALSFANTGSSTCTEMGTPGLQIVDSAATAALVATAAVSGPYGYYGVTSVSLAPGQVAVAYLASSYLSTCPSGASLDTTMPDGAKLTVPQLPTPNMCGGTLLISPLVAQSVPVCSTFDQPTNTGVLPENDGTGYVYGTDSGSAACSGHTISYNGVDGQCGFYGGQIGAYWLDLPNCPSGGRGWVESQANAANAAISYGGTGTSAVFFVGGPGMDPKHDYTGGTPTSAQVSEAESWGDTQAVAAENQIVAHNISLTQPTLSIDIEVKEGWEGKFTTSGGQLSWL